jgi:hypothetical protein
MKLKDRSPRSKEKFADSIMSVANAIHSAAFIGVLVFPLTAFVTAMFTGVEPVSFLTLIQRMSGSNVLLFCAVYLTPIAVGVWVKGLAMDLYDEVEKQKTQEESTSCPILPLRDSSSYTVSGRGAAEC